MPYLMPSTPSQASWATGLAAGVATSIASFLVLHHVVSDTQASSFTQWLVPLLSFVITTAVAKLAHVAARNRFLRNVASGLNLSPGDLAAVEAILRRVLEERTAAPATAPAAGQAPAQ